MAANFNSRPHTKGPVTVREMPVSILRTHSSYWQSTGKQLKQALEHSAEYFRAYEPGKPASDLVDEKIPAYNFDIAEGVNYDLDISKPFGQRIQNLSFQGKPVRPEQKFRLALTTIASMGAAATRCTKMRRCLSIE